MKKYVNGVLVALTADELAEMENYDRRARLEAVCRPLTFEEVQKLALRRQVNSLCIDDATASRMVDFYPEMTDFAHGDLIAAKTVINHKGTLKRAAVDLWNTDENSPDNAPTLWQDISYRDGIRIIPAAISVTEAFAKGERGWWGDAIYTSLLNDNVYTPEQYPAGWELA